MLLNKLLIFLFLVATFGLFAQEKDSLEKNLRKRNFSVAQDSTKLEAGSLSQDSLADDYWEENFQESAIDLKEVLVLGRLKFDSPQERVRYLILQRKTRKVWPFATLAANRLEELNARLEKIEDKSDRKKYIRMIQDYLEGKFKDKLKNLTKTEGQILVKLLYRQTSTTTYELVRELRSGWNAFWYNATAGLFNISLKEKYLPESVEEDFLIEDILQRSFRKNILEPQEPAIDIDYLDLLEQWR